MPVGMACKRTALNRLLIDKVHTAWIFSSIGIVGETWNFWRVNTCAGHSTDVLVVLVADLGSVPVLEVESDEDDVTGSAFRDVCLEKMPCGSFGIPFRRCSICSRGVKFPLETCGDFSMLST